MSRSAEEAAALKLFKRLNVEHSRRSYIITVSYTAEDLIFAAQVANAFALQYAKVKKKEGIEKRLVSSRSTLTQLSSAYGNKHPEIVRASEEVSGLELLLKALDDDNTFKVSTTNADEELLPRIAPAVASSRPSSPEGLKLMMLAVVGGLLLGCVTAIWRDLADKGYRSEAEARLSTGIKHIRFVPECRSDGDWSDSLQSLRSLLAAMQLVGPQNTNRLVLVAGVEHDDPSAAVAEALTKIQDEYGSSTVCIFSESNKKNQQKYPLW